MNVKEFHRPATIKEAVELLSSTHNAKLIAGGTDLVIALKERVIAPDALIDLSKIEEMHSIRLENETLYIGALTTFSDLRESEIIRSHCPAFCEMASQMGARQIQNLATLGGNVANASNAADGIPLLLSLNAVATVRGAGGERSVPVEQLVVGMNQTSLASDELITEFQMQIPPNAQIVFEKIGRRKALAISRINLAVCMVLSEGTIRLCTVTVGAVGKTAYRVSEVEAFLLDKSLSEDTVEAAACLMDEVVARNLAGRSTTPYKRKIAASVLKQALERIAKGEVQ